MRSQPSNQSLLTPAADAAIEDMLLPFKLDLVFNPDRFTDGWKYLADAYHSAAEVVLIQASEELSRKQWKLNTALHQRFVSVVLFLVIHLYVFIPSLPFQSI